MILIDDFYLKQHQREIHLDLTQNDELLMAEFLALCKNAEPEVIVAEGIEANYILRLLPEIQHYCGAIALKQPLCDKIDFIALEHYYLTQPKASRFSIQIQLDTADPNFSKLNALFYMIDAEENFDNAVGELKNTYFLWGSEDTTD